MATSDASLSNSSFLANAGPAAQRARLSPQACQRPIKKGTTMSDSSPDDARTGADGTPTTPSSATASSPRSSAPATADTASIRFRNPFARISFGVQVLLGLGFGLILGFV